MRFALITEGVSEHKIIKHILSKYFKGKHEIFIRDIQPQILNDKQETNGGWNEVLKYCERTEDLIEIFNNNDYLVIQIDTDLSQTIGFDVSHTKADNTKKSTAELCADVVEKLKSLIHQDILDEYQDKIFFAICVDSIECWLLPIYYTNNHKSAATTCISKLNAELKKKNINPLPEKDKNNHTAQKTYETILKNWSKKKEIEDSSKHNVGFEEFVNSLSSI